MARYRLSERLDYHPDAPWFRSYCRALETQEPLTRRRAAWELVGVVVIVAIVNALAWLALGQVRP